MSRPEIIKNLKTKHPELNSTQLQSICDIFFQKIEDALKEKKTIELRGFGTFFIKEIKQKYSARKKNKIRFRASKKFKEFLNQ